MMFKKINLDFTVSDYILGEKIVGYGKSFRNNRITQSIFYTKVAGQCIEILNKLFPKEYHSDFNIQYMQVNNSVGPHTDSDIKVTINHYLETNNEETVFYTIKSDNVSKRQVENQTNGYVFNINDLEKYDSFVANKCETWVLDVTNPHAVIADATELTQYRKAIVINTNKYSYETVLDMLLVK